eukprot:SAG31_NODE_38_length_31498_cov_41.930539_12_plen_260_part_00
MAARGRGSAVRGVACAHVGIRGARGAGRGAAPGAPRRVLLTDAFQQVPRRPRPRPLLRRARGRGPGSAWWTRSRGGGCLSGGARPRTCVPVVWLAAGPLGTAARRPSCSCAEGPERWLRLLRAQPYGLRATGYGTVPAGGMPLGTAGTASGTAVHTGLEVTGAGEGGGAVRRPVLVAGYEYACRPLFGGRAIGIFIKITGLSITTQSYTSIAIHTPTSGAQEYTITSRVCGRALNQIFVGRTRSYRYRPVPVTWKSVHS